MPHAHVLREDWKSFENDKSMKQLFGLSSGLCMIWIFCVMDMEHSQTIWFCRDKLSLAMLFWEDIIILLVCLKYYCFYVNIKLLFWIIRIWAHSCHSKEITWINMLGNIPHQKFRFYHLPTRGRVGIKLGDAWYVSNVSIIFYCSMLLYYLFRMFYMHYYGILYYFWD